MNKIWINIKQVLCLFLFCVPGFLCEAHRVHSHHIWTCMDVQHTDEWWNDFHLIDYLIQNPYSLHFNESTNYGNRSGETTKKYYLLFRHYCSLSNHFIKWMVMQWMVAAGRHSVHGWFVKRRQVDLKRAIITSKSPSWLFKAAAERRNQRRPTTSAQSNCKSSRERTHFPSQGQ